MSALEERERLRTELRAAGRVGAETTDRLAALDREAQGWVRTGDVLYAKRARGTATEDEVEAFEARRAQVAREHAELTKRSEGALSARRAIQAEMQRLYVDRLPEFVAEAEERTQVASRAINAVARPLMEAIRARDEAVALWTPLFPALRGAVKDAYAEAGVYPADDYLAQEAQVPESPLPDLHAVDSRTGAPRPRGLDPRGDVEVKWPRGNADS